ncbi:tetratricopeptide repeat-containing sensor histidine kinase [Chryseobacterium sp. WLY505]|uniref:tetratricopeptide repeat-containing sensor histidine kinase n=1 Tax=Chryseobacterium sp. WLY505 TaxID=3068892 RepID=UPI002796D24B|nr:tetratricopeptide repeat-containing sensor histidine kinase [Chryseobacterium sp. WLY505]MDQ1856905.1 tetratricopeptide repeat protein [Chryseobacterium sp. WLY505]
MYSGLKFVGIFLLFISCNFSENRNSPVKVPPTEADEMYNEATSLYNNDNVKAFTFLSKAESIYKLKNDSANIASCLIMKAIILNDIGDYLSSNERAIDALSFLKLPRDSAYLTSIYNNLAISEKNLKHYSEALSWYHKALQVSSDNSQKITIKNNIADTYGKLKSYSQAIRIYQSLLKDKNLPQSEIDYARILDNYNYTNWLENNSYKAEQGLLAAFALRQKINDKSGLISSHSHLAEYYLQSDKGKALYHNEEKYRLAKTIKNPNDRLEAIEFLVQNDTKNHLQNYFAEYQHLNDSILLSRDKAKNRFALIEFDVEKKNAENQKLKIITVQKQNRILKQNVVLGILSLSLVGGWIVYKRRKKRLQQENEFRIKENQLHLSKKVHDVVANGIYQVMTKIENQEDFDKERVLDELEFVYEKSRDISYEKTTPENRPEFSKRISTLIASFNNENVKTYLAGNDENIWKTLKEFTREEIYQIMRELLINMKKHSQATLVAFKFERKNNRIQIQYTDNGIGISEGIKYKNGLTNTDSRIEAIHGEIIFDTETEKGLKIYISLPAS